MSYRIIVDGEPFDVTLRELAHKQSRRQFAVEVSGVGFTVEIESRPHREPPVYSVELDRACDPIDPSTARSSPTATMGEDPSGVCVTAPMAGTIVKVLVGEGQRIGKGDTLFVLEAMKMETAILAPAGGILRRIGAALGRAARRGEVLAVIGPEGKDP